MTTLTVNIKTQGEQAILEDALKKMGFDYSLENIDEYDFSEPEIASFVQTRQNFIEGKTTARNWEDIEKDLNNAYNLRCS